MEKFKTIDLSAIKDGCFVVGNKAAIRVVELQRVVMAAMKANSVTNVGLAMVAPENFEQEILQIITEYELNKAGYFRKTE